MKRNDHELAAVDWLRQRWGSWIPDVGVVLGSGIQLSDDSFIEEDRVPVSQIPGLPSPSVEGHRGEWIRYRFADKKILVLGGRVHLYEGFTVEQVTRGIRVLGQLGTSSLILTNAAGGIRDGFCPGVVVAISEHLPLQGVSPLVPRQVRYCDTDAEAVYDRSWLQRTQARLSAPLPEGVYAALPGPAYETPAEIVMLRRIGADLVGMSTVPEALAAKMAGIRVQAFSLVTNLAAGISGDKLDHQEVLETGKSSQRRMVQIVRAAIESLN